MPRYLLDTNICIYIKNDRSAEVLERFSKLPPGAWRKYLSACTI